MFANGLTAELLVELVLAGLASAHLSKTHSIVAKPAKQIFFWIGNVNARPVTSLPRNRAFATAAEAGRTDRARIRRFRSTKDV